jgi:hypothetical protein
MAKMDELYNDLYKLCEEDHCWRYKCSIKEWNEMLGKDYGTASFTALVNAGKLERTKSHGDKSYEYCLAPIGKIKEIIEEEKRQYKIMSAERTIENHDKTVARIKARYEEAIRQAEEALKRDLAFEEERLEEAKALVANL